MGKLIGIPCIISRSAFSGDRVFRLNTDLLQKYAVGFDSSGVKLTDPTGRGFGNQEVYKAYWRWPEWPAAKTEENCSKPAGSC